MKWLNRSLLLMFLGSLAICAFTFTKEYWLKPQQKIENKLQSITDTTQLKEGDIIFQTSLSPQSKAIELATHSPYSHCGIIYKNKEDYYVFEAVQPVKSTKLEDWIKRGENEQFVVKRMKNADKILTHRVIRQMKNEALKMKGKNYDIGFDWSDDKMYCSELIWKIYKRSTGFEIGKVEHLKDFDLTNPLVRAKMKERYGDSIPYEQTVVSPSSIYNSPFLVTVGGNL